jgi:hypothetical protein
VLELLLDVGQLIELNSTSVRSCHPIINLQIWDSLEIHSVLRQ